VLFKTPHLIDSGGRMGDDVELVERDARVGHMFGNPFDESRRHVDAHRAELTRRALVRRQVFSEVCDGVGVLALGNEHHLPFVHIGGDGQIIMPTPAGRLVDRHGGHFGKIGFGKRNRHSACGLRQSAARNSISNREARCRTRLAGPPFGDRGRPGTGFSDVHGFRLDRPQARHRESRRGVQDGFGRYRVNRLKRGSQVAPHRLTGS
jgi:hypothetical protein